MGEQPGQQTALGLRIEADVCPRLTQGGKDQRRRGQALGPGGALVLTGIAAGSHSVTLAGTATNCSPAGTNPRVVSVVAGDTVDAAFAVQCVSTQGFIDVVVGYAGANVPAVVDAAIDGALVGGVAVGSSFRFGPYPVGDHEVVLRGPANCTAASSPRRCGGMRCGAASGGSARLNLPVSAGRLPCPC